MPCMYVLEFFIWDIGLAIQFDAVVKKKVYILYCRTLIVILLYYKTWMVILFWVFQDVVL